MYAKGASLERTVLGSYLNIQDLEWYGCPKYPGELHDPLQECIFFSDYVPEIYAIRHCPSPLYVKNGDEEAKKK